MSFTTRPVKILNNLEEALFEAREVRGDEKIICLAIADAMQDPMGMNMAIILDELLGKGYEPAGNGFLQHDGYRLYPYKKFVVD